MNIEKVIEACEWVNSKNMSYTSIYKGRVNGGVTVEVAWADWERKRFNPLFACVWKHYCTTHNTVNLKFNDLRSYYVEVGEYLECSPEMAEWYHIQLQDKNTEFEPIKLLQQKYSKL